MRGIKLYVITLFPIDTGVSQNLKSESSTCNYNITSSKKSLQLTQSALVPLIQVVISPVVWFFSGTVSSGIATNTNILLCNNC